MIDTLNAWQDADKTKCKGRAGFRAGYRSLLANGELARRADLAKRHLQCCDLCARYCRVDRIKGINGAVCRIGENAIVYSYGAHYGEENVLRGKRGSGTIFFSGCNLRCEFCQNWEISQKRTGREVSADGLAKIMLQLQSQGCHNINFVSPSHVVAQILEALLLAADQGLALPLVYNTGGYDSPEALALLDGVIDIYMPDMKYGDSAIARRYSHARDYWRVNRAAVREMHRQVGDLRLNGNGIAYRGLLVRHLVLPNQLAGTERVLKFIANEISSDTYLNLMDQYYPCYRAKEFPELSRLITAAEYHKALAIARRFGLNRLAE
ncbi:radical SAM protein [Methylomarinum vadi]|uniref:radical SAM protein n=1 Tax=Methylomarinum vadi TaxID=438855 RepID=UPI000A01EEE8|nr:radical SAM protein [Methylomarinum vadi]